AICQGQGAPFTLNLMPMRATQASPLPSAPLPPLRVAGASEATLKKPTCVSTAPAPTGRCFPSPIQQISREPCQAQYNQHVYFATQSKPESTCSYQQPLPVYSRLAQNSPDHREK